jgi:hypothetical protein
MNNPKVPSNRLNEIDGARGTAMIAVCLSHFLYMSYRHPTPDIILNIVRFASPAFMLISGTMLGYLFQTSCDGWGATKRKLIDRSFFLLTVGHILMMMGSYGFSNSITPVLKTEFITDNIGLNILVGCYIVTKLRRNFILILSILIISCNYFIILNWDPQLRFLAIFKEAVFGTLDGMSFFHWIFPLFVWLSIYVFGIYIGIGLAFEFKLKGKEELYKYFGKWFLGLIIVFVIFKGVIDFSSNNIDIRYLMCAACKSPPSPGFFIFYGAISLALLFILFKFSSIYLTKLFLKYVSLLGRNSFFVFVVQYFVYSIVKALRLKTTLLWPIYFIISLSLISTMAFIWEKKGFNRLISMKAVTNIFLNKACSTLN